MYTGYYKWDAQGRNWEIRVVHKDGSEYHRTHRKSLSDVQSFGKHHPHVTMVRV